MTAPADYPYDTRLNVLIPQMQRIDVQALADAAPHKWYNQRSAKSMIPSCAWV